METAGQDVRKRQFLTSSSRPLSGYVKVFWKGKDRLNVRKVPCIGENVDQVVYDRIYTVVGISADVLWYKLKSGLFITSDKRYVQFMGKLPAASSYMVKVEIPDLNIRKGLGTGYARAGRFTGAGVFTIVEGWMEPWLLSGGC